MSMITRISKTVRTGDADRTAMLVKQALEAGNSPLSILVAGLMNGLLVTSRKFRHDAAYLPELLQTARAMSTGALTLYMYCPGERFCFAIDKARLSSQGRKIARALFEVNGIEVQDITSLNMQNAQRIIYFYSIYEILETLQEAAHTMRDAGMHGMVEVLTATSTAIRAMYRTIGSSRPLRSARQGA